MKRTPKLHCTAKDGKPFCRCTSPNVKITAVIADVTCETCRARMYELYISKLLEAEKHLKFVKESIARLEEKWGFIKLKKKKIKNRNRYQNLELL